MRMLFVLLALMLHGIAQAITVNGACPVTAGTITLSPSLNRSTGVSPLLVFVDNTATTDSAISGNMTVFQDVTFTENFGDTLLSGTSAWLYGSRPGINSRNLATGGLAAHLYITQGRTTQYTITVTATDGTNTAICGIGLTVYDPTDAVNGFPGTATICQAAASLPVAGSGGCPAGAAVSNSASESTNITSTMSATRVLFKCGDSFTGAATVGGTTFSIGAYGGCQNSSTSRPIFSGPLTGAAGVSDGRISDIDFESTGSYAIVLSPSGVTGQMTIYNTRSNGNATSYYFSQGHEYGWIQNDMTGMTTAQGVYLNVAQNNCVNASSAYNCGGSPSYNNIAYTAVMGNHFVGTGASNSGQGIETLRISACRGCSITNNTITNANNIGAVMKLHSGNTFNTSCIWIGQWTENVVVSDNYFAGNSGAELVEIIAQNQVTDERIRNIVVERNIFAPSSGTHQLESGAMNLTARDNIFNASAMAMGNRGYQGSSNSTAGSTCSGTSSNSGAPVLASYPQYNEFYNNTCYNGGCGSFGGAGVSASANNSVAKNGLVYLSTAFSDSGTGNTVSNNTVTTTNNPGFTNGSGGFTYTSDFKPTANFSGATSVPVFFDALGIPWSSYDLGAVHH